MEICHSMKKVGFYIVRALMYAISAMPFWLLYRLSDFVFLILYYVVGYRKKVVSMNLKNSFPEKSEAEIKQIQRKFYRYFCDLILETLKTLTISPKTLLKRATFANTDVFQKYYDQKQSIIIVMGHFGNWELGGARFAVEPFHKLNVIYHPIKDKNFDKLVYKMRTRLGNGLYAMKETIRGMVRDRKELTATAFIADQTPSPQGAYWMEFLNQDTPVFTGTGKIANKMKYPVVYASVRRPKRGRYEIHMIDLVPNPAEVEPFEIVAMFTKELEKDILRQPEIWLWTHKRWKHKRNA